MSNIDVAEPRSRAERLRALPAPEPAAGTEAYRRERELALARSPECRANYQRYQATRGAADPGYLPIKLDIENVSRCNFRCTMCVVGDWPKGQRAQDMPLDAFKRLIDEQVGLLEIKLQGVGEPTLQRDEFFAMIRYARARHIWVRTTTNASLLHLNDNGRKLIDADVNELQISIDGATPEVYEQIRRGGKFERVLRNVKAINAYQRERGVERTKMWTVVQQGNRRQLPALVDLAADLGFTNQVFSLELSDWGIDAWHARNGAASAERELDPDALEALVERGKDRGVRVRFWNATEKYRFGRAETLCPWPFERAFIGSDLRVVPCCYIGNPEVAQIDGEMCAGHGFTQIWRGEAYRAFRLAHLEGRPPSYCLGCYAGAGAAGTAAQAAG